MYFEKKKIKPKTRPRATYRILDNHYVITSVKNRRNGKRKATVHVFKGSLRQIRL